MHQTHPQSDSHEVCISRWPLGSPLLPHERLIPSLGTGGHRTCSSQNHNRNRFCDKIEQSNQLEQGKFETSAD